jgi:hypothetical protein
VRGDSVAAIFARADTVYLFHLNGDALSKLRIPFVNFRHVTEPPPGRNDPTAEIRWRGSYSTVSRIYWAADGTFFVQYYNMDAFAPRWGLLHMSRSGDLLFDLVDSPRLLAVLGDQRLLFEGPSDAPERWRVATLRRSR